MALLLGSSLEPGFLMCERALGLLSGLNLCMLTHTSTRLLYTYVYIRARGTHTHGLERGKHISKLVLLHLLGCRKVVRTTMFALRSALS